MPHYPSENGPQHPNRKSQSLPRPISPLRDSAPMPKATPGNVPGQPQNIRASQAIPNKSIRDSQQLIRESIMAGTATAASLVEQLKNSDDTTIRNLAKIISSQKLECAILTMVGELIPATTDIEDEEFDWSTINTIANELCPPFNTYAKDVQNYLDIQRKRLSLELPELQHIDLPLWKNTLFTCFSRMIPQDQESEEYQDALRCFCVRVLVILNMVSAKVAFEQHQHTIRQFFSEVSRMYKENLEP